MTKTAAELAAELAAIRAQARQDALAMNRKLRAARAARV